MQAPLQLSFHNMEPSEAIAARVRDKVAKLEKFYRNIISCRVAVEAPHRQPHKSTLAVTVDVAVPGKNIVVKRERRTHAAHEDAYRVIQEVFELAQRQLEDHTRVIRREVKSHESRQYGQVVRLEREAGHGFVETPDGRSVFFARPVVQDDAFDRLEVGSEVLIQLADGEGPMGPQASLVQPVGTDHSIR